MRRGVIFVIIFAIIIAGVAFYKLDKDNVYGGIEPKYCLKFVNEEEKTIKYLGLGYALYRKYDKSPNEVMNNSKELKFGIWFLDKKTVKYSN